MPHMMLFTARALPAGTGRASKAHASVLVVSGERAFLCHPGDVVACRSMASSNTIYVKTTVGPAYPANVDQTLGYAVQGSNLHGPLGQIIASTVPIAPSPDPIDRVQKIYPPWQVGWAERDAGTHTPRIYQGSWTWGVDAVPPMSADEANEFTTATDQEDILSEDLTRLARVTRPDPKTHHVYGSRIRDLLIRACTEVESQMKGVMKANGAKPQMKRFCTLDYVKLLGPMRLDEYAIRLTRYRDYPVIEPFKGWDPTNSTASIAWYDAYNATKHDREQEFHRGTLEHALSAAGALVIMLAAQYGPAGTRMLRDTSFFTFVKRPDWHHRDRNYAPPPGGQWTPVPYQF